MRQLPQAINERSVANAIRSSRTPKFKADANEGTYEIWIMSRQHVSLTLAIFPQVILDSRPDLLRVLLGRRLTLGTHLVTASSLGIRLQLAKKWVQNAKSPPNKSLTYNWPGDPVVRRLSWFLMAAAPAKMSLSALFPNVLSHVDHLRQMHCLFRRLEGPTNRIVLRLPRRWPLGR